MELSCHKPPMSLAFSMHYIRQITTWLTNRRHLKTYVLAYQTLGMVYGGLSTTPLYLYSSIPLKNLSEEDYLGILSIIFWTLTLIGGIKYVLIVLQADDQGEGGTFALYSLLRKNASGYKMNINGLSCDKSDVLHQRIVSFIQKNWLINYSLFPITMLATCMVMGDGILTPAISVLSAVEGIKIAAPSISQGVVVVVSGILLVALFSVQKFGTQCISFMFSPIILAWLISTPLIGLYNILVHYPAVYKAISPFYMCRFFITHGKQGWLALGGTSLCISGVEAMFADLGHFNRSSMQLGFLLAVYPSNLITYAGLTAYLIRYPENQNQAFYKFTPRLLFWPIFLVSTLAAIVASQGLISACFSLIKQCVSLDCFPRVRIIHTSREREGQVYSPEVNFSLMVLCTAIVIGFNNGGALANAYGVAVILVMMVTTLMMTLVMILVWGVRVEAALMFLLLFSVAEGCNLSAVLVKVPLGGWLPFLLSAILALLVSAWVQGRQLKAQYQLINSISISAFQDMLQHLDISKISGVCFAYTKYPEQQIIPPEMEDSILYVPPFLQHYVKATGSVHGIVVLVRIDRLPIVEVPKSERICFTLAPGSEINDKKQVSFYLCTIRVGYKQKLSPQCCSKGLSESLLENLETFITRHEVASTLIHNRLPSCSENLCVKSSQNVVSIEPNLGLGEHPSELQIEDNNIAESTSVVFKPDNHNTICATSIEGLKASESTINCSPFTILHIEHNHMVSGHAIIPDIQVQNPTTHNLNPYTSIPMEVNIKTSVVSINPVIVHNDIDPKPARSMDLKQSIEFCNSRLDHKNMEALSVPTDETHKKPPATYPWEGDLVQVQIARSRPNTGFHIIGRALPRPACGQSTSMIHRFLVGKLYIFLHYTSPPALCLDQEVPYYSLLQINTPCEV